MDGFETPFIKVMALPAPAPVLNTRFDLSSVGYTADEYLFSGEARSFELDEYESVRAHSSAPFCTRLLVFRPEDAARYSGTAAIEWLNVSGGFDLGPEWIRLHRHLIRSGAIWVGVSTQRAGVDATDHPGTGNGLPLKVQNPERYALIEHPGDGFAYDIFSQAGRLVKQGGLPFGEQSCVLAIGSSQSARFLTTYVNRIDPLAKIYDGFLITGRHKSAARLDGAPNCGGLVYVRDEPRAPVFVVQPESDPFGRMHSFEIRQPDTKKFRLWEVAGASHGDTYLVSAGPLDDGLRSEAALSAAYEPSRVVWVRPKNPVNASPAYHYTAQAAFHHLENWARNSVPPPAGALLQADRDKGIVRDEHGVARGGARSAWVDAPALIYIGENEEDGAMESLFGETRVLPPDALGVLYPNGLSDYMQRFNAALDLSIERGFALAADAEESRRLAAAIFKRQYSA